MPPLGDCLLELAHIFTTCPASPPATFLAPGRLLSKLAPRWHQAAQRAYMSGTKTNGIPGRLRFRALTRRGLLSESLRVADVGFDDLVKHETFLVRGWILQLGLGFPPLLDDVCKSRSHARVEKCHWLRCV